MPATPLPPLVSPTPSGIILDFDGVVVDSLPVHLAAWQAAVAQVFRQSLADPMRLAGHSTRTIAHILTKEFGDPSRVEELISIKRQLITEKFSALPILQGAREFITALRSHDIRYGIASNSPRRFVQGAVEALGLPVAVIIAGDDVGRGKPQPDIFWACSNALQIEFSARQNILVFEDSFHGLAAARAAGMYPVGVASAHANAALLHAGAKAVCSDLADALAQGWHLQMPTASA